MILDSYSARSSNVCNQLTKETSEEPILLKRSSPSSPLPKASFVLPTSVLNSPRSVDDTMMDKSSRSPSVASDLDELETSSTKSNDVARPTPQPNATEALPESDRLSMSGGNGNETKEPKISQLVANVKRLESTINSLRETTASQISQLKEMLTHKSRIIADLEDKLDQQRDYDEIKRELSFMRNELSHFGPITGLEPNADPKTIESYLVEKSKALQAESLKLDTSNETSNSNQQMMQRHAFFNPFTLPQLQGLGNVESFGTLLGEEIANSYAKAIAKRDPSFLAMAAAAAVNTNNSCGSKLMSSNSATNNSNNMTDSLSPSQISNGDEAIEEKSVGSLSASTTPTSAMICPDGEPLGHSPLGATAVPDLGLSVQTFTPSGHRNPSANVSYDKLQQQLRCNVEKYMNENLNTLQISRCVRELLSMHNIGQRLFAKYVLGLSQGTVSELLSKPKPWDKLTEKGRDSYRKMHAWATDERCINLLKSMVPRKGKETSYKQEDPVAEERIAQILSEAQRSMKGVNRSDFFSAPFLNGEHHHHHHHQHIPSKMDREMKSHCPVNDNLSENGSERDDKSELAGSDRKSPASTLNATALATINNFYRNFNDSLSFNDRNRKNKSIDGDEMMQSPDLMRLYQDQLAKLIGQHIEEGFRNTQNYDEVRNAVSFYNQELSRMNPFAAQASNPELFARLFSAGLLNGAGYLGGLPLSLDTLQQGNPLDGMRKSAQLDSPQPRDNRDPSGGNPMESRSKLDSMLSQLKMEPSSPSQNGSLSGNNGTTNSVLSNGDLSAPEDLAASPLQRMQSITNSLLSQSSLPSLPTQSNRPAKAVLPPITQQQFDQYNNLNTEDIVKRVKEQLSQYSISQRLFGESVLGLSQGSVSDLLARPKPWHMLTQKGREPFIRMKMFLEDDNAIHKLVASQYKIAPEKLMRTGSFVAGPGMPSLPISPNVVPQIPTPPLSLPLNPTPPINKNLHFKQSMNEPVIKYEQSLSPSSVDNGRSNASTPEPIMPTPSSASSPMTVRQRVTPYAAINNNLLRPSLSQSTTYMQPSVYELAALTSDLDTQIITTRIKETLMAHNIGQKIFGEVVLGLSQGSVSELLSKPKPWHMLSIKGREPFIRMQLWLNDPNNIEKLQTLKNERREANKRRRTHIEEGIGFKSLDSQLFNFSNNFNMTNSLSKGLIGSPGSYSTASTPNNSQPVAKKARILFTEEQKEALRIAFAMDPYPSSTTAEFLAKELNLSIRTITNWFHNHRMRLKQINNSNNNGEESNQTGLPYSIGRDSVSFDQSHFRSLLSQRLADLKLRAATAANSNNSSNGSSSSNHYGSFGPNSGSSPQHRFKYSSPLFQSQSMYSNNTNSCSSPGSSSPFHEDEDIGTLDLSMSSHNQQLRHSESDKLDSTGRSSVQDDSDDGCRSGDEEEIETHSDEEERKISLDMSGKRFLGSSRRKPQHVMSSSSRRKAAQPQQWVAPDPICYGEDDFGEDDYEDDRDLSEDCEPKSADQMNGTHKDNEVIKRLESDDADLDDQKTDEEIELEPTGEDSDTDQEISVPPYKKLKSSTSVMSKLAISDDSSNIIQECVQ